MLPEVTPEQRAQALEKAAAARRERAELKELLRTGSLTLGEVFARAENDDIVAGTKVTAILQAMPGLGKVGTGKLLEALDIADNRRVRGLGARQRAALLAHFGETA